eukprot:gene6340-10347_t
MINQDEFILSCNKFCSDNSIQKEGWKIVQETYCVKKNYFRKRLGKIQTEIQKVAHEEIEHEEIFLEFEFHICYSQSYQVPILYFNVYTMDKKLLKHDEILEECLFDVENKFAFLTQGNHPHLSTIYYYLHPCKTIDFMNEVLEKKDKENYIKIWLGFFGSIIGYYLPLPSKIE